MELFIVSLLLSEARTKKTEAGRRDPFSGDGASIKMFIFHIGKSKRSTIIQKTNIK